MQKQGGVRSLCLSSEAQVSEKSNRWCGDRRSGEFTG